MGSEKKRLTLDLDPPFQRRLKVRAAMKGVSMRQYCLAAIETELLKDEGNAAAPDVDWSTQSPKAPQQGKVHPENQG